MTISTRLASLYGRLNSHAWKRPALASGLIIGILVTGLVWQVRPDGKHAGRKAAGVAGDTTSVHGNFDGLSETFATIREMRDTLSRLARQVEQLSISVAGLERKVQHIPVADAQGALEKLPPPAAGGAPVATAAGSEPVAAAGDKPAGTPVTGPADALPQQGSRTEDGHWVINLASFPDQAAVDRFMQEAADKGIETDKRRVSIKGKEYWRAQVTGFATSADALAGSAGIKQTLGLQDVWIARQ